MECRMECIVVCLVCLKYGSNLNGMHSCSLGM